ncbi:hypothetical protein COCNU_02G006850 [Cocos nucifera]|uniref:Uncharacterized protein n=1 Tax=Cocos nucifera TaxID=13894 RepID=A0A8K0HZD1_COCNU|nr:hypothetical protein COCNU_02G006850 [Cocos nucifera]
MVVLSRSRSSASAGQKTTPKLAVPAPLNLPSLRKEHERFEPSSSGTAAGHGTSGLRSALGPSSMGWSKPALPPAFQDNEVGAGGQAQSCRSVMTGDQRAGSPYVPPSSRPAGQPVPVYPAQGFSEKAVILRGEDFPSLRATAMSVPKQKEASSQKQRQKQAGEEHLEGRTERFESRVPLEMRPQMRSSRASTNTVLDGDGGLSRPSGASEQSRKQDKYLPGLLPLVRLHHTSDWADDERDTGLSIPERDRDRGNSRLESVQLHDLYDGRRGPRDAEPGVASSREFFRGDSFGRDVVPSNKEGRDVGSWRAPLQQRDRLGTQELGVDGDRADVRRFSAGREMGRETNDGRSHFGDDARDGGTLDSWYTRKDLGSGINTQNGRSVTEAFGGKGAVQNTRGWQGDFPSNWNRGNSFQNDPILKSSFSSRGKGLSLNDPVRNLGREKRLAVTSGKPYIDDADFDSKDPFLGGVGDVNVKLFKRKKDTPNQADFHDPVRESFEAELERILRMQEQERERVMEEQARVLELARKEEEERERLAREEEEGRRLLEEEAREGARRAEQERLEAVRRAEEQRIEREEEKRRILMEDERRKEAARQKLLELEARIARRQAEANAKDDGLPSVAADERMPGLVKERDAPRVADAGDWEEGERMVECITSSASSDSSSMNRYFDPGSRPFSLRDGNLAFTDGGKLSYHWNSGSNSSSLPFHNQENIYRSSKRDSFGSRRGFPKKEHHGGPGIMSVRPSSKGGNVEHLQMQDDFHHERGQRWSSSRDGDHFNRNSDVDADFIDNDEFGDVGWGPGNPHGRPHSPYVERVFQNSKIDGLSSFTRTRHSLKQPHVPPPPSTTSMHRSSYRPADHPSSSSIMDRDMRYHHASRIEQQIRQTVYDRMYQENIREPGTTVLVEENGIHLDHNEENNGPRCDSQSSLSVSSPPGSPVHPSHDEMDVSGDSPALPPSADGEQTVSSDNEHIESAPEAGNLNMTATSSSVSHGEDDEWAIENHEEMQEQEEYDEDNNYQEIDEVAAGDNENLDLGQEFKHLQSDVQNKDGEMDQVILGFNEGVEVKIRGNDEFEMTSWNSEKATKQVDSPGSIEEMISNGVDRLKADNSLLEGSASNSSRIINETEKALQDLVLDPVASSIYPHEGVEASSSSRMPAQNPVGSPLSLPMPSTSIIPPVLPSASTAATQGEVPVKLQFGLFCGPPLVPSPVPAIQIGSIQMPIHLHTQVGPSLAPMHPSQSPVFQFGQLRYSPPISQSVSPLGPQAMSFVQSPTPASYSLNQNPSGYLLNEGLQNSSQNSLGDGMPSADNQASLAQKILDPSPGTLNSEQLNALSDSPEKGVLAPMNQTDRSSYGGKKATGESAFQTDHHDNQDGTSKKNYRPIANRESQNQLNTEPQSSRFSSGGKAATVSKAPGNVSGARGRRFAYSIKNAGSKLSFSGAETLHTDSGGFQGRTWRNNRRTEFRVRENFETKQMQGTELFYHARQDERPSLNGRASGISVRNASKKDVMSNRLTRMMNEPDNLKSGASSSQVVSFESKTDKATGTGVVSKSIASADKSHGPKGTLKTNGTSVEDVDAPLQSGVVRIFKQPGIEAPSNEDNFIEVRSKRQMLNDRREQREKEIKSRSRVQKKAPRKQHSIPQSSIATANSNKAAASLGGDAADSVRSELVVTEGRGFASIEPSIVFMASASQNLPPIGTPSVNADSETRSNNLTSNQTVPAPDISAAGANLVSDLLFDGRNVAPDNASLPLGSWDSANLNKVMALTQTQLDEAMKPAQFDSHVASSMVLEPHKPTACIMTQEKPLCSSTCPVNSLLAGEKIQFGAVTSPTILPPVSRTISNGLGPPGSCRLDVKIDHNLPAANNDCNMYFDKEKHPNEPCPNLEDPEAEAEAEAAASAVAVAAITSDEMVGSGISACSASAPDTKSFSSADITRLATGGVTTNRKVTGQSAGEESLTVALPADLSVDTPLSLWPPLPSPQSSGPMLSHFPGALPSHFPCLEMSPVLGGRIFAFGSHDESGGTQGQSQRSTTLGSGLVGPWPQCPSGVDSFYGPPGGFAGPFISPGGIPGVQGPPHMVVYNHFAPVGQFGQVGLSFMGTTYIPTGKQPDWKHNPTSSTVGDTEGNLNNLKFVSGQCTSHSMPTPLQHLGPGSPLMPMASPLTMFDITPFQSSADIPMQARWSHVAAPQLHSVPLSMPLQLHHVEGGMPLQYNHNFPVEASNGNNKFHEPPSSILDDGARNIPVQSSTTSEFSGELGLVEQLTSSTSNAQTIRPSYNPASGNNSKVSNMTKTSTRTTLTGVGESSSVGETGIKTGSRTSGPSPKTQQPALSGQQYLPPIGYADHRSGASQKIGSGGEWHRRTGFQGRNQGSSMDKNFGSAKMKQIYVVKPSSGPANPG